MDLSLHVCRHFLASMRVLGVTFCHPENERTQATVAVSQLRTDTCWILSALLATDRVNRILY